jgi:hypothetical protein
MTRVDDEFTVSSIFSPLDDGGADAGIEKPDGFGSHGEHTQATIMAPPTSEELDLLRLFDPDGFFLK